jgi:DNA-binding CsgD family transcriptional regulator
MFRSEPSRPPMPTSPSAQLDPPRRRTYDASPPGFILITTDLRPIYANGMALRILGHLIQSPESVKWEAVQTQLRLILQTTEYCRDSHPPAPFTSGRRRYLCRSFRLNVQADHTHPPLVALVMERLPHAHGDVLEASRRFHLSPRECETVVHLTHGLTNKEIAQRMKVSPNTVKQFIRLTMSKMSVTSRSGILGKALGRVANSDQSSKGSR